MRFYLSLDLALANVGWASYSADSFELLQTGTFYNPKIVRDKMSDLTHRAGLLFEFGDRIIEELDDKVLGIMVERPYASQSQSGAMAMGVVAAFCAYMKEIKCMNMIYLGALEIKTWNNSMLPQTMNPKEKAILIARELEGLTLSEHEADAICLFHFWKQLNNK